MGEGDRGEGPAAAGVVLPHQLSRGLFRALLANPRPPHMLMSVITAPHERTRLTMRKPQRKRMRTVRRELVRVDEAVHGQVLGSGGWRYWPIVRISTPVDRMSSIVE